MQNDSVDKIIERYFATVAKKPFSYKGKTFQPKPLNVSPLLLRDYTCPPGCGGCCFKFTLDYLPSEEKPEGVVKRHVEFNGRSVEIWSDAQEANDTNRCRYLLRDGRCGTYLVRPFSCDFELIRVLTNEDPVRPNILTQKLFGRGWSYARTDGGKGAKCEMLPVSEKSVKEVIRKLKRLQDWASHFKCVTWVPEIIQLVESGHLANSTRSVILRPNQPKGFGV